MSKHIETKRRLKSICNIEDFNRLVSRCILTDEERLILDMYYIRGKSLIYIAYELGYSESCVKKKHRYIIDRIGHILDE